MESTIQASQDRGLPKTKPSPPSKPGLTPKPFSLQKNNTIRSFRAPKTTPKTAPASVSQTPQSEKSEVKTIPNTTVTSPARKLTQPAIDPKAALKTAPTVKSETPQIERSVAESSPTTDVNTTAEKRPQPTTDPKAAPKTEPASKSQTPQIENEAECPPTTTVTTPAKVSRPVSAPNNTPKTATTSKSQTPEFEDSEAKSHPTSDVNAAAEKLPQPTSVPAPKPLPASVLPTSPPEETRASEAPSQNRNSLGLQTAAPDPATETTQPKEEPKSEPVQKDIVFQTNHKTPSSVVNCEQKDEEEKQSDSPVSFSLKNEDPSNISSSANGPVFPLGSVRNRLPKELTSKFESGGVPLPRQSFRVKPVARDHSDKAESSDKQQSQATPEPPFKESDTNAEDLTGGNSIRNRISLLFGSVSKPEITTKREELETTNGIGGVKEQIKNWLTETGPDEQESEKKPQAVSRVRSKGFEPVSEKSPETPRVDVQAEETPTQPVDPHSTVPSPTESQAEPSNEAKTNDKPLENLTDTQADSDKTNEDNGQPHKNLLAAADEKVLATDSILRRKKKAKNRRSVRFGTVVADDGGPPLILGPEPESSEDEKQDEDADAEREKEEEVVVPMPLYRRDGILQKKDEDTQRQETLKQLEQSQEEERKWIEEEEEREKEKARQKELELEEERKEMERLKQEQIEKEMQMEILRQKQIEEERERERVRLEEEERKQARMREEIERQRQKEEEKLIQKREEEQRQKDLEVMRQRKEVEKRLRQEELENQKLRREKEEREQQRLQEELEERKRRELEEQRKKELELIRQRKEEEERLRREELEKQKLKQEAEEKLKWLEEEERLRKEEKERKIQQENEKEMKRQEERKIELEKERAEELKRKMEEDLERCAEEQLKQPRAVEENNEGVENLINIDAEDLSQTAEFPFSPSSNPSENTESPINIDYDDFSVQNPVPDVQFDDFSVKPRRRTPRPREERAPVRSDWRVEPVNEDKLLVSFDSEPLESQQEKAPKEPEALVDLTPDLDSTEKERVDRLLIFFGVKEGEEKSVEDLFGPVKMEEEAEEGEEEENETEEEDTEEEGSYEVNSYSLNDEDEPTETLFPNELPQQDGISEPTSKPDSPTPVADQVPDVTSDDDNNTDSPRELDLASFPEISTPLLDTSSQRSKAVLSRRRRRTLPSRSIRLGSIKAPRVEPRVYHGEKKNESDSEEELPKSKPILTPPTSTSKVAMFPGLSSADLLAGIKRKTVGRAAEDESAEERGGKEKESQNKEVAPSHISGSPRLPTPLPGAARVLPRAGGKEGSSFKSPPWLKELKSKKRMNQNIGEN